MLIRRPQLAAFALAAPLALLGPQATTAAAAEPAGIAPVAALAVQQWAPGVYVHQGVVDEAMPSNAGDIANLGFVVGARCVGVIDTGSTPQVGAGLLAAVRAVTPLPVCYVIDTHEHPDHVLGNAAFARLMPRPTFVTNAKLPAALAAREPYYLAALQRDFQLTLTHADIVYPDTQVTGTLDLDLGGRQLHLRAWPTAHTDNDLTVFDAMTRTLFLGDLLFVRHLPALDGSLRGWLAVMDQLRTLDVGVAVPGHGAPAVGWPTPLAAQHDYLAGLLADTRAAIQSGRTLGSTVDAAPPPAGGPWELVDAFHKRNATAAYAELEWEN